jgi:hypothetical protein
MVELDLVMDMAGDMAGVIPITDMAGVILGMAGVIPVTVGVGVIPGMDILVIHITLDTDIHIITITPMVRDMHIIQGDMEILQAD